MAADTKRDDVSDVHRVRASGEDAEAACTLERSITRRTVVSQTIGIYPSDVNLDLTAKVNRLSGNDHVAIV